MKLLLRSLVAFYRDDGSRHAGSIAYFFLMSFAPFCLLLVAIFGYFLGDNKEFYEFFAARLLRFFPEATSEISRGLTAIVTYRKIGVFTLIVYAFFSYLLYSSLEAAVHVIFQEKTKRSLLISVVMSFVMISFIALCITVSFAATSLIEVLKQAIITATGLQIGAIAGFLIRFVIPIMLVFIIVTTLYKFMPVRKTTLRRCLKGEGCLRRFFLKGPDTSSHSTWSRPPPNSAPSMGLSRVWSFFFCGYSTPPAYSLSVRRWSKFSRPPEER